MTLLEVILTVAFLATITITIVEQLKGNIDLRMALGEKTVITHRMSTAMSRLVFDLKHAFILGKNDIRKPDTRNRNVTMFRISPARNDSNEIAFTSKSNRPIIKNQPAADSAYVVYKLEEMKGRNASGRYNLMRGSTDFIPDDFRDDPKMQVLASNLKSFKIEAWRGDRWVKDRWDSTRGEWRYKMPSLVKIILEFYVGEPADEEVDPDRDVDEIATEIVQTIVHLPNSEVLGEVRPSTKASINWEKL